MARRIPQFLKGIHVISLITTHTSPIHVVFVTTIEPNLEVMLSLPGVERLRRCPGVGDVLEEALVCDFALLAVIAGPLAVTLGDSRSVEVLKGKTMSFLEF